MPRTIIENIVIQHYENANNFEFCQYTNIRFFEIVYFDKGYGTIKINNNTVSYTPKSVFIFIPNDVYIVQAEKNTTVTTIKFLKSFFTTTTSNKTIHSTSNWFRKIESILHSNSYQLPLVEFRSSEDKTHLTSLIEMLNQEYQKRNSNDILIIENLLTIVLHLIARNIPCGFKNTANIKEDSKIQDILNYIHSNIYDTKLLTSSHLGNQFHISEKYVSQYFKKNMGESLKRYILNYKLKIVETKLEYTNMTYSEIALELGFTDVSHLNRIFKTYKGMSIGNFKTQFK